MPQGERLPAFSLRALILGVGIGCLLAALTPLNDWWLRNTPFYNNAFPPVVALLALLFGLVINPLLGARRFRLGEMVVVLAAALAVGGVASGGLMRRHTAVVAGMARSVATKPELATVAQSLGEGERRWPFDPSRQLGVDSDGRIDVSDPEYRATVDRFFSGQPTVRPLIEHRSRVIWEDDSGRHEALAWTPTTLTASPDDLLDLTTPPGSILRGLREGDEKAGMRVIAVQAPDIPWDAWWPRLLAWSPLLIAALAALLGLAGVVRKQWIEHERLTYPISSVMMSWLEDPPDGKRLPAVFASSAFRWAFSITLVMLIWKGLGTMGWIPIAPSFRLELWPAFLGPPWDQVFGWWRLFNLYVWCSVVALAFLMPTDIAFSLWGSWIGLNLLYLFVRLSGIPIDSESAVNASVGGFAAWVVLTLWTGRQWYGAVLRAAWKPPREDAALHDAAWHARLLIAGTLATWLVLWWWGAPLLAALLSVLIFLGIMLVLARLVAEAGIPFVSFPGGFNQVLYTAFGIPSLPAAAIALGALGMTLLADSRENPLVYATHAQHLADKAKVRAPRVTVWMGGILVATLVISAVTMLGIAYRLGGHPDAAWQGGLVNSTLNPIAIAQEGAGSQTSNWGNWSEWGIGAGLVALCGWARLSWAGFPLHPIGLIACTGYPIQMLWTSIWIGWLAKVLVQRYGGVGLLRALRPAAIGIIAAEAVATGLFLIVVVIATACGWSMADGPQFMPR